MLVGYLSVVTVAAAWRSRRAAAPAVGEPSHRFAVLVPAYNEEQVIGSMLASLHAVDYPKDLFSVHVVADNCTDGTAAVVRGSGFELHERNLPNRPGKGPGLQWLIGELRANAVPYDALVFIDADTEVDPGFFRAMDRQLASGAKVVQGHYAVRDDGDSPVVAFRSAAMAARTFLRPLGREAIGGSAGLHGNGMMFRSDQVDTLRWSDHLTEDVELHLELLLDGLKVSFAPDARIAAEMPDTVDASRSQHERWERGRLELARRFVPRLVRRVVSGGPSGRIAYADAALDQLVPPLSVLVMGTAGWMLSEAVQTATFGTAANRRRLAWSVVAMLAQCAHVLTALRLVNAPPSTYRALLQAPRMMVWKAGLWARVLVRPAGVTWSRTTRNA